MTAAGRITTARLERGIRILVERHSADELRPTHLKTTGSKDRYGRQFEVIVATVQNTSDRLVEGPRRAVRYYTVWTDVGTVPNCSASTTHSLAKDTQ